MRIVTTNLLIIIMMAMTIGVRTKAKITLY